MLLFTLGNSSDAFIILRASSTSIAGHLSTLGVLGMMLTFNLVYTLLSTPLGALSDKIGRRRLMVGGWLLYGLVYLGFALAQAGWQVWALMAVYGVYYAATEGVAKAFVADLVPKDKRGLAYGVFNAAIGVMAFPASAVAGVLWAGVSLGPWTWSGWGPTAPFYFGAALALAATALLALALPKAAPASP
jgi:MFS family permease